MNATAVRTSTAPAEVVAAIIPDLQQHTEEVMTQEVTSIEGYADSLMIITDVDYQKAGEFGRTLKQKMAEVTDFFKPMKESANKAHKDICSREKAMLAPLKNAEQILKSTMGEYAQRVEEERRKKEAAIREAARRESERKLQEAVELEKAGKKEEAADAFTEAEVMDEARSYSVPPVDKPKTAGVSASKDWEIECIDPRQVPISVNGTEVRPVDKAALMRVIRESKGKITIPGVKFKEVSRISFRR